MVLLANLSAKLPGNLRVATLKRLIAAEELLLALTFKRLKNDDLRNAICKGNPHETDYQRFSGTFGPQG